MPHAGLTRALLAKAEPVRGVMLSFFSPNGYFALQILGLGKRQFSKKGTYFTYTQKLLP
jgi:hypothetical protein